CRKTPLQLVIGMRRRLQPGTRSPFLPLRGEPPCEGGRHTDIAVGSWPALPVSLGFYVQLAYPKSPNSSLLCTRQYSFHCPSAFVRPRRVKRDNRLLWRRLPKTGSTVAKRRVIISLPMGLSILHFIRAVWVSGLPAVGRKRTATCRTGVVSGDRKQ